VYRREAANEVVMLKFKGLVAAATFFLYFVFFIHSYITFIHIHAFVEASLRFFIAS
jgi:hypothetical protein